MEKEQPDSLSTVGVKPEYAPSDYSAAEPPPAYRKRMSSGVQIARLAAVTVVLSSLILGAFLLAAAYIQARASCHQLDQLDAMLDKELALEGRAYGNDALVADEPLPVGNAHALHAAPPAPPSPSAPPAPPAPAPASHTHGDDLLNRAESSLSEDKLQKLDDEKEEDSADSSEESDSSDAEGEGEFTLPLQLDLDDLAGAFLTNLRGRMSCVVERRREEAAERRFPFNLLAALSQPSPTERVAIVCHAGPNDDKAEFPEPAAQVFAFPLSGPPRLPVRPPPPAPAHRPAPFPLPPMSWDSSEEQVPRGVRIHVQRVIALPAPAGPARETGPAPNNMIQFSRQDDDFPRAIRPQDLIPRPEMLFPRPEEMPFQQRPQGLFPRPQDLPFSRPQEMPFPRPQEMPFPRPQEMSYLRPDARSQEPDVRPHETLIAYQRQDTEGPFNQPEQIPQQPQQQQASVMQFVPQPQQPLENREAEAEDTLPWGLTAETLRAIERHAAAQHPAPGPQPAPSDMQEMKSIVNSLAAAAAAELEAADQAADQAAPAARLLDSPLLAPQDAAPEERPHYVQPRSVRSVDALLHREKRVKRCTCDCA